MDKIKYLQKKAKKVGKRYRSLLNQMEKAEAEYNQFIREFEELMPAFNDDECDKATDILKEINNVFGLELSENKEGI